MTENVKIATAGPAHDEECCCGKTQYREESYDTDCMICGAKLVYSEVMTEKTCAVCGKKYMSNSECEDGHFVCDTCHAFKSAAPVMSLLRTSSESDPLKLFEAATRLSSVHMHGPEHHVIVPLVMVTACRNAGLEFDYNKAMKEVYNRASQVPGGTCGNWGVCGAAAGAGIFASVLLGSDPLNKDVWHIPQKLVSDILAELANVGGPRCCKRTGRIALEKCAKFVSDYCFVDMETERPVCRDCTRNRECIRQDCPYFPKSLS